MKKYAHIVITPEEREICEKMDAAPVELLDEATPRLQTLILRADERLRKKYSLDSEAEGAVVPSVPVPDSNGMHSGGDTSPIPSLVCSIYYLYKILLVR